MYIIDIRKGFVYSLFVSAINIGLNTILYIFDDYHTSIGRIA